MKPDTLVTKWTKDTFYIVEKLEMESDVYYELYSNPVLPVHDSVNVWVLKRLNLDFPDFDAPIVMNTVADVKKACIAMNDEYLKYKTENDLTGPWSINWSASISEPFKELVCLYILE